jgi:uncharacterized protein
MIRNSFIFLPKISNKKEQNIWDQGINTWNEFLKANNIKGISKKAKIFYDKKIKEAKQELIADNPYYFQKILPNTETWRLYEYFKDECCFLDIESYEHGKNITIIGLYDGFETKTMVKNINLDMNVLKKELSKYKLLITFNGSSFDIPNINKFYPETIPKIAHIDLRHASAKAGFKGGLKLIEEQLNIKRPKHLKAYGKDNPTDLWRAFLASGDKEYLDLLIQYNEEDIINLKPLMEHVYNKLKTSIKTSEF